MNTATHSGQIEEAPNDTPKQASDDEFPGYKEKVLNHISKLEKETGLFATEFIRCDLEKNLEVGEIINILSGFSLSMFMHAFFKLNEDVQILMIDAVYNNHDELGIIGEDNYEKLDNLENTIRDAEKKQDAQIKIIRDAEKKLSDAQILTTNDSENNDCDVISMADGVPDEQDDPDTIIRKAQNEYKSQEKIKKRAEKEHHEMIAKKLVYSLIKIWACKTMIRALREMNILDKIEEYEANHRALDKNCQQFLNKVKVKKDSNFFKNNYCEFVYEERYMKKKKKKNCCSIYSVTPVNMLEMAIESKALFFLSSNSCQAEVRKRWDPVFRKKSYNFFLFDLIYFALTLVPLFLLLSKSNRSAFSKTYKYKTDSFRNIIWFVITFPIHLVKETWGSPSGKFALHWIFRLFYCLCMAYQLLKGHPYALDHYIQGTISVMYIQLLFMLDSTMKMIYISLNIPSDSGWLNLKFAFFSSCDWETFLFLLSIGYVFSQYIPMSKVGLTYLILERMFTILFFISFIYATLYLLFILSLDHFYSSIILTIKKMAVFTIRFFILFLVFWIAYGVCVVHIQDSYVKNETRTNVIWRVFKSGSFEIFGEADDKYADGINCGDFPFDSRNITSPGLRCIVDSWFMPISLFLYMFVSAVVLVNLLTAFLTQIHEDHKETRIFYKHYMKCKYLIRYEKSYLFPPLLYTPYPFVRLYQVLKHLVCPYGEESRRDTTSTIESKIDKRSIELVPLRGELNVETTDEYSNCCC